MVEGNLLSFSEAMNIIENVRDKVRYREPQPTEIVEAAFRAGVKFAEEEMQNESVYKDVRELDSSVIAKLKKEYLIANPEEREVSTEQIYEIFKDTKFQTRDRYTVIILT